MVTISYSGYRFPPALRQHPRGKIVLRTGA
jgi:hypothetical protein